MNNLGKAFIFCAVTFAVAGCIWLMAHRGRGVRPAAIAVENRPVQRTNEAPGPAGNSATLRPAQSTEVGFDVPEASLIRMSQSTGPSLLPSQKGTNNAGQTQPAKKELVDPWARQALTYVGADPQAEAYWFGAINDPTLPPNERQDLIEDLNEEGLSDAKHPGPEDMPLILSRLELIEMLGPYAMDEVNFRAFQEAYKDLWDLWWMAAKQ